MTRAVFKDTDGHWTYVMGETEYDLGPSNANRYIWACSGNSRQQVCDGGGFRGSTLSWPCGPMVPGTWRDVTGRAGHKFSVCDYKDLPDAAILQFLAKALGARAYKSRASYDRHYKIAA